MKQLAEFQFFDSYTTGHYQLDNGLEALLLENPISPVSAYLTQYRVGSALEMDDQRGLAHFFEHMMFRETETLGDGDFDRIMAEIGGVGLNAFTSYDTTAYHVNVPTRNLERVMALEADRMASLRLSKELIEKERGAVLGELKMYQDMPSDDLWNHLMAAAFQSHPYRHPIIGYADQVAGFSESDFSRFYNEHYMPNRAVVVVAGGFDKKEVLDKLQAFYGHLPSGPPLETQLKAEPRPGATNRVELTHARISSATVVMGFHTPGLAHKDIPALVALSLLLSGGKSAPFYQKIVQAGLGTHASTTVMDTDFQLVSPGMFLLEVSCQQGVAPEAAEEAMMDVVQNIKKNGVAEEELRRGVNQMRLGYYSSMGSNMSMARQLGGSHVACGDPLFGQKLMAATEKVTPAEVEDVLSRYLLDAHPVVVTQREAA